jgi:hypothetical protein
MKLTLQKLYEALLTAECKLLAAAGNESKKQNTVEKLVLLHTQMRVEKEQNINKLLFNNL